MAATMTLGDRITAANLEAHRRILASEPVLVDVQLARDAIPRLPDRTILHAGPPIGWERMCGPMRGAVAGAIVFEGWAKDLDAATRLAASGEIRFEPNHHYDAVGPMTGMTTRNMAVLVVENLAIYKERGEVPLDPDFVTPIGLANVARVGTDITLVAHSYATVRALHVAERLQRDHGISAEVVDLRSLRPLDVETVAASVAKTSRAVCIEEGWPTYGVSAEIAARIQYACFDDLDAPVERVGMAEVPMPYAKELENAALPNEDRIEAAVLATLGRAA